MKNRLSRFLSRFLSPARRGILFLSSGTVLGQVIMILSVLVLAQLYEARDFGIFALFGAFSVVGAAISGGRYEMAVVIPETAAEAQALVKLAIGLSMTVGAGLLGLLGLGLLVTGGLVTGGLGGLGGDVISGGNAGGDAGGNTGGNTAMVQFCLLLPLNICLMHAILTLNQWTNRNRRYPVLATVAVLQAIAINAASMVLGLLAWGAAGLMLGAVLGRAVTLGYLLVRGLGPGEAGAILRAGRGDIRALAVRFSNHPRHLLPAVIVGNMGMQMPILMLSTCFGATVVGYYSMASRFITLPTTMVSRAIGEIYRERISVRFRETGQFRPLFIRTITGLVAIAVIPYTAMYLLAPDVFGFMLGPEWLTSADFARILIVSAFFQFTLTPTDKGSVIVGATWFDFFWQLSRLGLSLLVFAAVFFGGLDVLTALWLVVAAATLNYLTNTLANYHFSSGTQKE